MFFRIPNSDKIHHNQIFPLNSVHLSHINGPKMGLMVENIKNHDLLPITF